MKKFMRNLVAMLIVLVGTFTLNAQELNKGDTIKVTADNILTKNYDNNGDSLTYNGLSNEFMNLDVQLLNGNGTQNTIFKLEGEKTSDDDVKIYIHISNDGDNELVSINERLIGNEGVSESDGEFITKYTVIVENFDNDTTLNIHFNFDGGDEDGATLLDINLVFKATTETSINSFSTSDNTISVYPNPVTNFLNVSGEFETVNVYDVSGKQLLSTNDSMIDVSNLDKGIYIVNVIDGDSRVVSTKKIIKR